MSDIEYLKAEIAKLRNELRVRPILTTRGGGTAASVTILPWLSMLVHGGQTLITSPSNVYGVKRKLGETKSANWKHVARRATASCTISGGSVNSLTLTDCGIGYGVLPTVTVTPAPGGGTNAVITPTLQANGDRVEGVYLTSCGSGYTNATATFDPAPGGGVTATGNALIRDGKVVAITVTNKGRGYTSTPNVTIAGDGAGAAATAVRGLKSISLAITNAGSGYTTAPTITVQAPSDNVAPAPPSVATPSDPVWDDGLGWGTIIGGSLTGGVSAGPALICHDDRGMVAYGLMGDGASVSVPFSRPPDSILSWYQTLVRLSIADPDADGVLPAWVPMAGGV